MVRAAIASPANTAIIPLQDYLGLDDRARINTPSTLGGNWEWRLLPGKLTKKRASELYDLSRLYGRVYVPEEVEEETEDPSVEGEESKAESK